MTYVPGQPVHFEGVDYIVRAIGEHLGADLAHPGAPLIFTVATLEAVDESHEITVHVLNQDRIELLEEAT